MSRLYLIRHGEPLSGWGEPGGSPDPGLSERGRAQAQAAAEALSSLDGVLKPTRILTSPFRRCRETAAPLCERLALEAVVTSAVAEIPTPGDLHAADRAPWLRQAMADSWGAIVGIDGLAWRQGVVAALLQAQGCAVFTHFVAINAAVTAATGSDAVLAFKPAPGSVTTLAIDDGRLVLVGLGEALGEDGRVL